MFIPLQAAFLKDRNCSMQLSLPRVLWVFSVSLWKVYKSKTIKRTSKHLSYLNYTGEGNEQYVTPFVVGTGGRKCADLL